MSMNIMRFGHDTLPKAFANTKVRFKADEVGSKYNNNPHSGINVSGDVLKAVQIFAGLEEKNDTKRHFFLSKTDGKNATCYVELGNTTSNEVSCIIAKKGAMNAISITAGEYDPGRKVLTPYHLFDKAVGAGHAGTAILLAIMPFVLEDVEAITYLSSLMSKLKPGYSWDNFNSDELEEISRLIATLGDNIYRRIYNPGIDLLLCNSISFLSQRASEIKGKTEGVQGLKWKLDTPEFFQEKNVEKKTTGENLKVNCDFYLNEKMTEEAKKKIAKVPDYLSTAEWTINFAKYVKKSSKYPSPIRTGYFVGPSGTGKTTGSVAIAALLGLSYDHKTCDPRMNIFDFFGQYYPSTKPNQKVDFESIRAEMGLPSVEDIMMDLDSSYIKINKAERPANITESDVICQMMNLVNAEVSERTKASEYTFVEGGLTKALRKKGANEPSTLFEIQEAGIVKGSAIVGLNAIMESGEFNFVQLPTGEVIEKDPNCVIVFTSNNDYEGVSILNQSVLSRLSHVEYFKGSEVSEMIKRTKQCVPDIDDNVVNQMANIITNINAYCKDNGIDDGVCGQRELNNWAIEYSIDIEGMAADEVLIREVMRETCQKTVLNKVSQSVENIDEVADGCVNGLLGLYDTEQ